MKRTNPQLVLAVMAEALRNFGTITPENRLEVGRWVQAQCEGDTPMRPWPPRDFDAKARAAGDDE